MNWSCSLRDCPGDAGQQASPRYVIAALLLTFDAVLTRVCRCGPACVTSVFNAHSLFFHPSSPSSPLAPLCFVLPGNVSTCFHWRTGAWRFLGLQHYPSGLLLLISAPPSNLCIHILDPTRTPWILQPKPVTTPGAVLVSCSRAVRDTEQALSICGMHTCVSGRGKM